MKTVKDVKMYYHSSLRNVGLFSSISLALFGAARSLKDDTKALAVYFGHLIFLLLAIYILSLLIFDLKNVNEKIKVKLQDGLFYITYITFITISFLFLINLRTFISRLYKFIY